MLLHIGETAESRVHKDKLLLRVPEADGKEREYIVVSMTPGTDIAENLTGTTRVDRLVGFGAAMLAGFA